MRKIIKKTGLSEGFLTLYFIILFLEEIILITLGDSKWYEYLCVIPIALVTTFIVIIVHMIIHYVILKIPDENSESNTKKLTNLLNSLIEENKELKEKLNKENNYK